MMMNLESMKMILRSSRARNMNTDGESFISVTPLLLSI